MSKVSSTHRSVQEYQTGDEEDKYSSNDRDFWFFLNMTLKMAENSGAALAGMKLTVFVFLNIHCSRKTRWGALHLRPQGLDLPGFIFCMILNQ